MSLDRFRLMTAQDKDEAYKEIVSRCTLVADCWLYPVKNSAGYGQRYVGGKMRPVSRFMLAYVTRESLNLKMDACHIGDCPYRNCCNPRHLEWGTHSENAKQREQKEREGRWDPRWARDPVLGHETHVAYTIRSQIRAEETIVPMQVVPVA
jgi:hypothetical protein